MSINRVYGDVIEFTSRSSNPIITLRAGAGEVLSIEGLSSADITETVSSSELGYSTITFSESLQNQTTSEAQNQGTFTACGVGSNETTYLIAGCPKALGDLVTRGGLTIWSRASGALTFTQDYFFQDIGTTSLYYTESTATYGSINEAADCITYTDMFGIDSTSEGTISNPGNLIFIRRTNDVWAVEDIIQSFPNGDDETANNCLSSQVGNSYCIVGFSNSSVKILKKETIAVDPSGFTVDWNNIKQTLQTGNSNIFVTSLVGLTLDKFASYVDFERNVVKTWSRSIETWTLRETLGCRSGDSRIVSLAMKGKVLAYCTAENLYVLTKNSINDAVYSVSNVFPLVSSVVSCSISTNNDSTNNYVICNTATVMLLLSNLYNGSFIYASQSSTSGAANICLTDSIIAVGCPTLSTFGVVKIYNNAQFTPVSNVDVNAFTKDDRFEFNTLFSTRIYSEVFGKDGGLYVEGDISTDGRLMGFPDTKMVIVIGTTLTVTTGVDTEVAGVTNVTLPTSDIYTVSKSTGRITCTQNGLYSVKIFGQFASSATGLRSISISQNGDFLRSTEIKAALTGSVTTLNTSADLIMYAGEYISMVCSQTSLGNLELESSRITVIKLGEI